MTRQPGKVFVGGLSWDTTDERLRTYFENYGQVDEAFVNYDKESGAPRGFGFVVFADPAVAARVVSNSPHHIDKREVEAKVAEAKDQCNPSRQQRANAQEQERKIFVGGLHPTVDNDALRNYFEQFGQVQEATIHKEHETQRPRGFGFVTFRDKESLEVVYGVAGHQIHGKDVEVKQAVSKEECARGGQSSRTAARFSRGGIRAQAPAPQQGHFPQQLYPQQQQLQVYGAPVRDIPRPANNGFLQPNSYGSFPQLLQPHAGSSAAATAAGLAGLGGARAYLGDGLHGNHPAALMSNGNGTYSGLGGTTLQQQQGGAQLQQPYAADRLAEEFAVGLSMHHHHTGGFGPNGFAPGPSHQPQPNGYAAHPSHQQGAQPNGFGAHGAQLHANQLGSHSPSMPLPAAPEQLQQHSQQPHAPGLPLLDPVFGGFGQPFSAAQQPASYGSGGLQQHSGAGPLDGLGAADLEPSGSLPERAANGLPRGSAAFSASHSLPHSTGAFPSLSPPQEGPPFLLQGWGLQADFSQLPDGKGDGPVPRAANTPLDSSH